MIEKTKEEEILELEQKLAEKKRALAETETLPQEKEVLREILREEIERFRPTAPSSGQAIYVAPPAALTDDLKKKAEELKKKETREEQLRELIEFALTRGIEPAVKIAEAATPWILDELHDRLVDDYYDKLVALRKVKSL